MVLKKVSLAELAYRELVRAVIDGSLAAGERLAEEQLAERFGISRTPVREALRRLNEEGLVETVPRCGFRVCRPEPAEIEALFDCRARIEPLALELAWGKIPADRLRELAWALEQAERSSDRAGRAGGGRSVAWDDRGVLPEPAAGGDRGAADPPHRAVSELARF